MQRDQEDEYFAEQLEQIKQKMIPTKFGKVFALSAGISGQPLILIVHGSGPRNSSQQYRFLLHEYLVRISYIQKFYIIAIDCPGYGRSENKSKDAIKTFPLELFRQILVGLGYRSYFAMFGHSQGGSAIFHAVHEDPYITEYLIMDRPVCGNIQRFHNFPLPTLLIYDIQDDGHPIWQGKLLYKQLRTSQFWTFRTSQQPYWVPDHIWEKMLSFFARMAFKNKNNQKQISRAQFHRSFLDKNHYKSQEKHRNSSLSFERHISQRKTFSVDRKEDIKRQTKSRELLIEDKLQRLQQVDHSEIQSMLEAAQQRGKQFQYNNHSQEQIFDNSEKISIIQNNHIQPSKQGYQLRQERENKKHQTCSKQLKLDESQRQNICVICYQSLYLPLQTNCEHTFCTKCLTQSLLVDDRCPLCRTKVTKKTRNQVLHKQLVMKMSSEQIAKKRAQHQQLEKMIRSIIYVEIGNTSNEIITKKSAFSKTKKKYAWEVYVKKPKNFEFQEVMFNINMGNREAKPISAKSAPYSFQNKSTFSFSCEITIRPKNRQYANHTAIYRIDVQPGQHKKIIALKKKRYTS